MTKKSNSHSKGPRTKQGGSNRSPKSTGMAARAGETNPAEETSQDLTPTIPPQYKWMIAGLLLLVFVWSYWPTLGNLVYQWQRIPDYSHGFLVIPIALLFAWLRWDTRPEESRGSLWIGIGLLLLAGAMRVGAARYYLEPLDGWSIPFWVAGTVALLWGNSVLVWALPSIVFLFFMIPLPYSLEQMLAQPLQSVSTKLSTGLLQALMQPAVAEGNTIVLGDETLEVARACSGLRIFMGIAAMAFAVMVLFPRSLFNKAMIALSVIPIALTVNSLRIVATGLLYQMGFNEAAKRLSHDVAGWVMIPLAAALFGLTLWYLDRLFQRVEQADASQLVRRQLSGPT